ncbi:hypothetical protein BLOT_009646 [Blomia tropicalis]|nr:hypothetical protein BLOT_009646 [Blomia tropicalis]
MAQRLCGLAESKHVNYIVPSSSQFKDALRALKAEHDWAEILPMRKAKHAEICEISRETMFLSTPLLADSLNPV